ncbi:hypothetical protein C8J56DRAFT_920004 [Mycena floridula]|nr:hypothetical protein C8J56DRAFT_920004 [Mycena floridula]
MFTVKASYRGETRRFTFDESSKGFPSFLQLYNQLYRVFPISHSYFLSQLLFSPDATQGGRILIGREVHNASEYMDCIAPFAGHAYPNALLRFSVLDETPRKLPKNLLFTNYQQGEQLSLHSSFSNRDSGTAQQFPPISISHIPPPPIIYSSNSPSTLPGPMDVDSTPLSIMPGMFHQPQLQGAASTPAVVSPAQGKSDVESLISKFKDDLDNILKSAFPPSSFPSLPTVPQLTMTTPSIFPASCIRKQCSSCFLMFQGPWYNCEKCKIDICPQCMDAPISSHCSVHSGPHQLKKETCAGCPKDPKLPGAWVSSEAPFRSMAVPPPPPPLFPAPWPQAPPRPQAMPETPAPVVHRGVLCDVCDKTIEGSRHKCLDCPDYDLCTKCITSGSAERHNPFHEFLELKEPGRVIVHTVHNGLEQQAAAPAVASPPAAPVEETQHSATCDLCSSYIFGVRYKCVKCPDFDTCSSCFSITAEQHPNHAFVKIKDVDDYVRPSDVGDIPMHFAVCNACSKGIYGIRYKCMHPNCADFDLCEGCEALPIPVHPTNHPLLKMRSSDTLIPTVYRAGQTIEAPSVRPLSGCSFGQGCIKTPPLPEDRPISPTVAPPSPFCYSFHSPSAQPVSSVPPVQFASSWPDDLIPSNPFSDFNAGKHAQQNPFADPASVVTRSMIPELEPLMPDTSSELRAAVERLENRRKWEQRQKQLRESIARALPHLERKPSCLDPPLEPVQVPFEESPLTGQEALLTRPEDLEIPEMSQSNDIPVSSAPRSLAALLDGYQTETPLDSSVSAPSVSEVTAPVKAEEIKPVLGSAFLMDVTVPDGQVLPPGAEFMKCWRMMNNGTIDWPASTQLTFLAGMPLTRDQSANPTVDIGSVKAGDEIDVWTGELKAPDAPGRYVSYWRLKNENGLFGANIWLDITVAEASGDSSHSSMTSSSVIMPQLGAAPLAGEARSISSAAVTARSTPASEYAASDAGSDASSVSLISVPTSSEDDWQDSRAQVPAPTGASGEEAEEYVVLYEESSSEED